MKVISSARTATEVCSIAEVMSLVLLSGGWTAFAEAASLAIVKMTDSAS